MLSRLLRAFGKRPRAWEDPDPRVRREGLHALLDEANGRARLAEIATRDVDASVRDAALHLIDDPAALFPLCERERERPAALRRLAALAATGRAEDILRARPDLGQALLQAAQDPQLAERLLAAIDDPDTLVKIATDAQSPRTRLRAAERVQAEAQLVALERASRGSDKSVHRLVRERLDLRRALRADCEAHVAALAALQARASHLRGARHGAQADPQFDARLDVLERTASQWREQARALEQRLAGVPDAAATEWSTAELDATLAQLREDAALARARRAEEADARAREAQHHAEQAAQAEQAEADAPAMPDTEADAARPDEAKAHVEDDAPGMAGGDSAGVTASEPEHLATLAELRAILDDVIAAGDALPDRIAMAPAAIEILERRWAAASERAPATAADAAAFRALCRTLKDGAAAAQRFDQAASELATGGPGDAAAGTAATNTAAGTAATNTAAGTAAAAADADTVDAGAVDASAAAPAATLALPATTDAPERWQQFWQARQAEQRELGRLQNLQRRLHWPEALPAPPAVRAIARHIDTLRASLRASDGATALLLPLAEAALASLETIADSGQLRAAQQQLAEARRLLRCLPHAAAEPLQGRLALLAGRVQELRDWQGFATQPKREVLCERMAALAAEAPDDPEARADRIKALRAEWQALGVPGSNAERALADRFNADAQAAFEPCRQYFDELAVRRAANLAERERVLQTLEGYLESTDWARADWKLAQQVLRVAREEFMSFSPVERAAGRDQSRRFDAAADRLHGLIKAELDRNLRAKEALVARAEELAATPPADRATLESRLQQAKDLQYAWRGIGITPRGPDQKLWRAFRGHCDAVFAARETQREAEVQAAESEAQRGEVIVEALEARVQDEREITDSAELQAALDGFDALGLGSGVGRDRGRQLQRRLRDAEGAYLQRLRAHQQAGRRDALWRWLRLHDELLAAESGSAPWPEAAFDGAARAIAARQQRAEAGAPAAEAGPGLRHWTLYAEILAGVESPPEDRAARLELQVGRLSSTMGRREGAAAKLDMPEVLAHWVAAADKAPAEARERMARALEAWFA